MRREVFVLRGGKTTGCKETAPSTVMKKQHKIVSHCKTNQSHEDDSTFYFKSRCIGNTTEGTSMKEVCNVK